MKITILSFGADWIPREWEQLADLFKPEIGDLHFPGINPGQATRDSATTKDTLVYLVKLRHHLEDVQNNIQCIYNTYILYIHISMTR